MPRRPTVPPPAAALHGSADDVEAQFYDALRRADIDRLMAVWADDDEIVCVHPGGGRAIGAAAGGGTVGRRGMASSLPRVTAHLGSGECTRMGERPVASSPSRSPNCCESVRLQPAGCSSPETACAMPLASGPASVSTDGC